MIKVQSYHSSLNSVFLSCGHLYKRNWSPTECVWLKSQVTRPMGPQPHEACYLGSECILLCRVVTAMVSKLQNDEWSNEGNISSDFWSDIPQIARFMWPTWGPHGSCRPHVGPMLAPWTLLSGTVSLPESNPMYFCIPAVPRGCVYPDTLGHLQPPWGRPCLLFSSRGFGGVCVSVCIWKHQNTPQRGPIGVNICLSQRYVCYINANKWRSTQYCVVVDV